ncbi:hypothetical protein SHIRM173S_12482 [Streptomyces hirsutus]
MAIPLVVGIDGSEASLEAVDWATDEAVRHGVPLHLLHAAAGDHEASGVIGAASERARQRAPTVRPASEAPHEDAVSALIHKGRNAFALVLGSRGLGDLTGMLLGTVSLAVAARADCPVVVVRGTAEHRDGLFGNIVVGVEEGEGSGTALQFAFREAHVRNCRLTAVHAWNPSSRALTPRPASSWYALETHRRPPSQVSTPRGAARRARIATPGGPQGDWGPGPPSAAGRGVGGGPAGRRRTQAAGAPGPATGPDQPRVAASRAVACRGRSADLPRRPRGTRRQPGGIGREIGPQDFRPLAPTHAVRRWVSVSTAARRSFRSTTTSWMTRSSSGPRRTPRPQRLSERRSPSRSITWTRP